MTPRSNRWVKTGRFFQVDGQADWMAHHATHPVADLLDDQTLRVYFAPRDGAGKSRITFIEVNPDDPGNVKYVHDASVLDLGQLGTFDDSGVMAAAIVNHGSEKYLYYVGWMETVTVPYRNSIGLAISRDGGLTFERIASAPILDRTGDEPFFVASPYVLREGDTWRMWYASSTGWLVVDGQPEPVYVIKYAESADGIAWDRPNVTCIPPTDPEEANASPTVVHDADGYRMWYCFRFSLGYRHDPNTSYRIGYAESADGISWERRDDAAGIALSPSGWDSVMLAYPNVYEHRGRLHLLYNGNGFGESGIGHAVTAD